MDSKERLIKYINEDYINNDSVLKYLKEKNIKFVENNNGYFFNINLLSDDDIIYLLSLYTNTQYTLNENELKYTITPIKHYSFITKYEPLDIKLTECEKNILKLSMNHNLI
jgi:hypothetical protein